MDKKNQALAFFADLLGIEAPKEVTLFDEPITKPVKRTRKWIVRGITIVHKVGKCQCCTAEYDTINPQLLLRRDLVDHTDTVLKSISTATPTESDLALVSEETEVIHEHIVVASLQFCSACLSAQTSQSIRSLFHAQVSMINSQPAGNRPTDETLSICDDGTGSDDLDDDFNQLLQDC